ncbi:MAG: hypothetical protein QXR06_02000 [Candidatus Bathyarchaeia archaeon]|nr:hypothetical protein [Candidatus Bathyarchaeota archaeon]
MGGNFILRITREEWFRQVFTVMKYYPGIIRRWEPGGLIFLARRTDRGDSFVGYGVIKEFIKRENLSEHERRECEKMGWKGAVVFNELYRFDPPLPIKETALSGLRAKGRCWHGYPLTDEQSRLILNVAEELCIIQKVG